MDQHLTLDGATLAGVADTANQRLGLPLTFTYEGEVRVFPAAELARLARPAGPLFELDEARLGAQLAEWLPAWIRLDPLLAVQEPALEVRGGRLAIVPGRAGLGFDVAGTAAEAALQFRSLDPARRSVAVGTQVVAPRRTESELLAASPVGALVTEPVSLYSFAGQWELSPEDLVAALRYGTRAGETAGRLDAEALAGQLGTIAREVHAEAARLELGDAKGAVLRMDVRATAQMVIAALETGGREATIVWLDATS